MGKLPWIQWFAKDWIADSALTLCAPATRGVWMDLLMHMHLNGRVGILEGTIDQLAILSRCSHSILVLALADLKNSKSADVTERCGIVTVVNRRMAREHKDREGTRLRMQRMRKQSDVTPPLPVEPDPYTETDTETERAPRAIYLPSPSLVEASRPILGLTPENALSDLLGVGFSEDWIRRAISVSVSRGKPGIAYLRGILQRWRSSGRPDDDSPTVIQKARGQAPKMLRCQGCGRIQPWAMGTSMDCHVCGKRYEIQKGNSP